jgi:hypothetical protein
MNSTPHKSECPATTGQNAKLSTQAIDSTKLLATLKARFAMHGHAVMQYCDGDFSVSRWGQTRYCQDIEALVAFGRQIGVTK